MLSLSPRADLFVFKFPKDFLPQEIEEKYYKMLNKDKSVIKTPIDYLNESIQGIDFPGLSNIVVEQTQFSPKRHSNPNMPKGINGGRINIEPARQNNTYSPANPLTQINSEFTVTLRKNQGFYNYFMLYETIFYKVLKEYINVTPRDEIFTIDILNESGTIIGKVNIYQPIIDGIDGLQLSYSKMERQSETFDLKFKFNNIDFTLL